MNKNFLSKKSWHTGSIKHMEKVWKAEQRDESEQKKMVELKRQLEEENRIFDMKKMQQESTGKEINNRLEWMYAIRGPSAEEYLTGTSIKTSEKEELEKLSAHPGALWLQNSEHPELDNLMKVKDDPLLSIKQQQHQALKDILQNPVKMKKIKDSKEIRKLLKKIDKKKKKKEKKERKKEGKKNSSSSEDDKKEKNGKNGDDHHNREHGRERIEREGDRHRDRDDSNNNNARDNHRNNDHRNMDRDDHKRNYGHDESKRGNEGNNNSKPNFRRPRKEKLSAEERQKKIDEMMKDGEINEERRWKRIKTNEEQEKANGNADGSSNQHAAFIDEVNKGVYLNSKETLEDRMKRNIHYVERTSNEESGIFRK